MLKALHQDFERVGRREHADDLVPFDDHGAAVFVSGHFRYYIFEPRLRSDAVDLLAHPLLDALHLGVHVAEGFEEIEVSLRHYPHELSVLEDREVAEPVFGHDTMRDAERLVFADGMG